MRVSEGNGEGNGDGRKGIGRFKTWSGPEIEGADKSESDEDN